MALNYLEILSSPVFVALAPALCTALAAVLINRHRTKLVEAELQSLKNQLLYRDKRIGELENSARDTNDSFAEQIANKSALVSTLNDVLAHSDAERATFYVPVQNANGNFLGLIVLATAPSDLSENLFIGTVFSGKDARAVESFFTNGSVSSRNTSFQFDGFSPNSTYAECLQTSALSGSRSKVGVVQLLSSSTNGIDANQATKAIQSHRDKLVSLGQVFCGDNQSNIEKIGLKIPSTSRRGTVLSMDISNSSGLFIDEARSAVTMHLIQEVIGASSIEMAKLNGMFESYTGDGFLAAFVDDDNAQNECSADRAMNCALSIQQQFDRLMQDYRADLLHLKADLFLRFGLSTGVIHSIGFSFGQMRTTSILGRTASLAKIVCDLGPRDAASIIVDKATYLEFSNATRSKFVETVDPASKPASENKRVPSYFYS